MVEANDNPEVVGKGNSEDQELKEHIETTKVFRVLLELRPNEAKVKGYTSNYGADTTYLFSIVVGHVCEKLNWDEENVASKLQDFKKRGYVTLSLLDEESEEEQLIDDVAVANYDYSKIGIRLNEPQIMEVLINDSIIFGEQIEKMMESVRQLNEFQKNYESSQEVMNEKYGRMRELHLETASIKREWESERDSDRQEREMQAEALKTEVKKMAEERAKKEAETISTAKIEEELMLNGKIGAAMQNMQKEILQYMGIFIAIFALIGLNIGHTESWSISDFFHMNLVIAGSMATLLFFISVLMEAKSLRTLFMGILTAVLWIAAAVAFMYFPA